MLLRSRDHSNYFSHLLFQLCSPNIQRFDISSLSSAVALEISSAMIASWAFARNPQGTSDDEQSYKKSCPYKLANLMKTFSYVIHLWVTDPVSVFCVGWWVARGGRENWRLDEAGVQLSRKRHARCSPPHSAAPVHYRPLRAPTGERRKTIVSRDFSAILREWI